MTRWIRISLVVGLLGLCSPSAQAFLSDSASHVPPMTGPFHYNNFVPGSGGFPVVGGSYIDPIFTTTVTRLTNIGAVGSDLQLYSRNGFHNANSTAMFNWKPGGSTDVINSTTGAALYTNIEVGLSHNEISFDPVDPDVYYYFSGAALVSFKLSTSTPTTVHTFPAALQGNGGTTDYITSNGRYFVMVWGGTPGARVYDKQTDTVFTNSIAPFGGGGWVGITPNGSHLVTQAGGTGSPNKEFYSYAINTGTSTLSTTPTHFVGIGGDHGDLISASNGNSYEVKFNPDCTPYGVYLWDLTVSMAGKSCAQQVTQAARTLVETTSFNEPDGHLSCVSKGTFQDWCFWSSTYQPGDIFDSDPTSAWSNFRQEIVAMNVVTGALRRLAHHRSRSIPVDYFYNPRICVSWDGAVAAFASNMNDSTPTGYADMYALLAPLGAGGVVPSSGLKGGARLSGGARIQ
jgi:hypothetical protein